MAGVAYVFHLTAQNDLAGVDDHFRLFYYFKEKGIPPEIEIINMKTKRRFLSRIQYPNLSLEELRPGSRVIIYSKQYTVEGYDDEFTKNSLAGLQEYGVILVPKAYEDLLGQLVNGLERRGLYIAALQVTRFSADELNSLQSLLIADLDSPDNHYIAIATVGENATEICAEVVESKAQGGAQAGNCVSANDKLKTLLFPQLNLSSASSDRTQAAISFAQTLTQNRFVDSQSLEVASIENERSLILLLPSLIVAGQLGSTLDDIIFQVKQMNLRISNMKTASFSKAQAEQFLDVYKTVIPSWANLVNEYSSGVFLALEVIGVDAVNIVRNIVGPRDFEIAKRVRPTSLRAKHGNGQFSIHATDLQEDGALECNFIFSLL